MISPDHFKHFARARGRPLATLRPGNQRQRKQPDGDQDAEELEPQREADERQGDQRFLEPFPVCDSQSTADWQAMKT